MDQLLKDLAALERTCTGPEVPSISIDNDPVFLIHEFGEHFRGTPVQGAIKIESQGPSSFSLVDTFWSQCRSIAEQQEQTDIEGAQLGAMVLGSLSDPDLRSEELQGALVDMLGFENLDLIAELISRRQELLCGVAQARQSREEEEDDRALGLTASEIAEQRRQKRLERAKNNASLVMSEMVDPVYPHVYRQHSPLSALSLTNVERSLPAGTVRESLPGYEYVQIPAQIPNTKFHPSNLLMVSDLDDLCKTTFSKYSTLNKIQTLIYPTCYESSENLLICAPTGAGKTDVALLSILSTIKAEREREESWKIVYVAPLKALAAEITEKLGSRLAWLGIRARELTGDMQLTRAEIAATHILVTTPEKWDVVTRKPNDDSGLAMQLRLLIIDEVHLLHEERGSVIESIVARTRRLVESQQRSTRIVGLSATLPNFEDVAEFLGVNPQRGLFYFDGSFRPVPLEQQFFGVKSPSKNPHVLGNSLDKVAYDECVRQLRKGHSVMIFVHSRRDTTKTAQKFMSLAQQDGISDLFLGENADSFSRDMKQLTYRNMQEIFQGGFAVHHAGMSRAERNMSERLFSNNGVRVLCCTATLAWGVNLPAAVVIIKGTQVYDAQQGGFVDLGISDVIQIFGRAGRPQFKQSGTGILCTSADKLDHYLSAITNQHAIESKFLRRLPENLNAEIALGTVTSVNEAIQWLGYTYLYVRMRKVPQIYGLLPRDVSEDPALLIFRRKLVIDASRTLRNTQMIIFHEDKTETLTAKDIGRIASEYYLLTSTVEQFNQTMNSESNEIAILSLLCKGEDFSGLRLRREEVEELEALSAKIPYSQNLRDFSDKASTLLQAHISRVGVSDSALASDMAYVVQNSARVLRAFFLLCVSRGWAEAAHSALTLELSLERRTWPNSTHPVLQINEAPSPVERRLVSSNVRVEDLKTFSSGELGDLVHNQGWGPRLYQMILRFPSSTFLLLQARPLTSRVVRIEAQVALLPPFKYDYKVHGFALHYWLFMSSASRIIHAEKMTISAKSVDEAHTFQFVVPYTVKERQVVVKVVSDSFLGAEATATIDFGSLKLPVAQSIKTNLLRLRPLGVNAWKNTALEKHYGKKFQHFNPMQTMVFHSLYYNVNEPVLLGSPTGSGKTIACEIAVWAALRERPASKVVYIAPMKALVKERVKDWEQGICQVPFLPGNRKPRLVELTGDTQPTGSEVRNASLIITTPEKFDGISRHHGWAVNDVFLIVMDEVHLLASDRGAILEVIVSRLNKLGGKTRLLGMSTAVANAGDLADWLGVRTNLGVFNFPSSVRPVPLEMYIDGFPDVQGGFCPLMKSMNKPTFTAIKRHSPTKPVLVFVASRRQTRLTALDLINMSASDDQSALSPWLHMDEADLEAVSTKVKDETLRHCLQFGVAIHHAGLEYSDRQISHDLFARGKVQLLVATSTLAWGVNLPAYLVIVKGTQFFDAKLNKYKDMDLTDVLQMMGRAGRPAFDSSGVAVVLTRQSTKQFYKYFLNLGFPVESSLHKVNVLENHIGAEISSGRIRSMADALDFMSHTFLYRRAHSNPTYYLETDLPAEGERHSHEQERGQGEKSVSRPTDEAEQDDESVKVNLWIVQRVTHALAELEKSQCLSSSSTEVCLRPTPLLTISSFYYLSHLTIRTFLSRITAAIEVKGVLQCLAMATEYDELAIRHNEDLLNSELSKLVEFPGEELGIRMVDPHVKAYMLVQARMRRLQMPVEDYHQDTITVLDQAVRILQALIDTAVEVGLPEAVFSTIRVLRNLKQGVEARTTNMLSILPGVSTSANNREDISLKGIRPEDAKKLHVPKQLQAKFIKVVNSLPRIELSGHDTATITPSSLPVYCPMFHKPQRESWFFVVLENGKLMSLERLQKRRSVQVRPGQKGLIMNDTVSIDYEIYSSL